MAQKLEKVCKIGEALIGHRYSFNNYRDNYLFTILSRNESGTSVYYETDGSVGLFRLSDEMLIYEVPMSSLEKELI